MKRMYRWLERAYEDRVQNDFDVLALFLGGEGAGKSTLMLQHTWLWQQIRGQTPTPESVLDRMVYDNREAFRQLLLNSQDGDAVVANDAAHILYKKDTMVGEQKETEKTLLDIRIFNHYIMLGYQDWSDVTDQLQSRRAHFAFRIPQRGRVEGYSRDSLDYRYNEGEWPEPDLVDTFPKLDGSSLWEAFVEDDRQRKEQRLKENESPDADDVYWREQAKTAFRAVKPWSESEGLTYREAAKLIDYSPTWISNRVDEWDDGYHRDLLTEDEQEAIKHAK